MRGAARSTTDPALLQRFVKETRTMRVAWTIAALALVSAPASAFAGQGALKSSETDRLQEATEVLGTLGTGPDKDIPADLWGKAECVLVIPDVKKAAFMVGGEYGKGVATCRTGSGWSAPAFYELEKGSWGFQAGAEEIDLVLLVMNKKGMQKLLENKVSLGAGASVAAGPLGRTARANTDLKMDAEILSWSRSKGVFAGVDLNGGALHPDEDANRRAYGESISARQILASPDVKAPAAAASFLAAVRSQSAKSAVSER
jgi:lipid-binding SYLF domain-containing protein